MEKEINKADFLNAMHESIRQRISEASLILDGIQESIDAEAQSTAGDKHDTSRELMQQERNKAAQNLQNHISMDSLVLKLKTIIVSCEVRFGSLVLTNVGWFFIGLPLGRIQFEDKDILCVSGNAPAAKLLESERVGASIKMNGMNIKILSVK
tara:strand:- start:4941 stop:5399 length:459 start_codon:yes stop_codon:yes gene_type:complete